MAWTSFLGSAAPGVATHVRFAVTTLDDSATVAVQSDRALSGTFQVRRLGAVTTTVSSGAAELSPEETLFLNLVYEHFDRDYPQYHRDQIWPDTGTIKRLLYQRGYRKVAMEDLLAQLDPAFIHQVELSGRRLRLTLRDIRKPAKVSRATLKFTRPPRGGR